MFYKELYEKLSVALFSFFAVEPNWQTNSIFKIRVIKLTWTLNRILIKLPNTFTW